MPELSEKIRLIRNDLRAEYLQPHGWPWMIGFSGGKDSTLILHLVIECLKAIAPDQGQRPVFLVCNDTLVESPVFHTFVQRMLEQIEDGIAGLNVPVSVIRTVPLPEESFWVNLLGRGYPAPNRSFRWCTDRMKIRPTSRFIRE
jgi:DNA sulfur modification protein DndC